MVWCDNIDYDIMLDTLKGIPFSEEYSQSLNTLILQRAQNHCSYHHKRKFPFVLFEEIYHQSSLHQRYLSHNRQYGVKLYDAIRS